MATVRSLDVAVRANTGNFETGMRTVSRALKATIVGMNAVSAAAAGQERSTIGMLNSVAIGFATGGPWGAAIAGAGIGLGMLIGKVKEADEEWARSMASMRAETEKLEKSAKDAADRLFAFRGGSVKARDLERIMQLAADARTEASQAGTLAKARMADIGIGVLAPGEFLDARAAIEAQQRAVEASAERGRQMGFAIEDARSYLALTTEQARFETDLLGITDERERRVKEINRAIAIQTQEYVKLANAANLPMDDVVNGVNALAALGVAQIDAIPEKLRKTSEAAQLAARSVSDFLSAVIVRGAQARDVLQSIAQTLLSVGIQRGVNAAFGISTP